MPQTTGEPSHPSAATRSPATGRRRTTTGRRGESRGHASDRVRLPALAAPASQPLGAVGLLLMLDWALVLAYQPSAPQRVTAPYSNFTQQIQAGNVASVTAQGSAIQGTFRHAVTYPVQNRTTSSSPNGTTSSSQKPTTTAYFATNRPTFADDHLLSALEKEGATVTAKPVQSGSDPLLTFLGGVLPTLLLIGVWVWIIQRYWGQMGGAGGMFGMGRSKAHKYEATIQRTTFADLAPAG
jgi:cell division protease FtsH